MGHVRCNGPPTAGCQIEVIAGMEISSGENGCAANLSTRGLASKHSWTYRPGSLEQTVPPPGIRQEHEIRT